MISSVWKYKEYQNVTIQGKGRVRVVKPDGEVFAEGDVGDGKEMAFVWKVDQDTYKDTIMANDVVLVDERADYHMLWIEYESTQTMIATRWTFVDS